MKRQELPDNISQKIKRIRGNLSQTEFAKRIGINRSLISSYESGQKFPSLALLEKLANYGRVSIDYLLGIEDVPSHKLMPEEDRLLHLWRKLPAKSKLPPFNILLYLLLIIGLTIWLKY